MMLVMWRTSYIIVSMLMLIRSLAFCENSFSRKILANFDQNRGFYRLNKLTSKVLWCDLKPELVTVMLYIYIWLVDNKTKKQKTDRSEHTQHKPKTSQSLIR